VAKVENRYIGPCVHRRIVLVYEPRSGKTAVKIDHILEDYQLLHSMGQVETNEEEKVSLTLSYCNAHKHHKDFLVKLAEMPEVESIVQVD